MRTVESLEENKDFIAFGFNYHGGKPDEVVVTNITFKHKDGFVVHFLYGYHSLSQFVKHDDVLAIGNPEGKTKIKGWRGYFDLVQPGHHLMHEYAKDINQE